MTAEVAGTSAPAAGWRRGLQGSEHTLLLTVGDAAFSALAVLVALELWTITAGVGLTEALETRGWWFLGAAAWTIGLAPGRSGHQALSVRATIRSVTRLGAALLVVYLAAYFYAPRQSLPRLLALYFAWEAALLTVAWRLAYIWVFTETWFRRGVLVVGAGPAGEATLRAFRLAGVRDVVVIGVIDDAVTAPGATVLDAPVLGGFELLPDLAIREGVSQIILAMSMVPGAATDRLLACQEAGISVVPMAAVYEQLFMRVPVAHLDGTWLFTSYAETVSARDASRMAKRLTDVLGGLIGVLVLALAAPIIALAVWLDSGGPVFYRQVRTGRGGRPFTLLKFRTMIPDAEPGGQPQWAGPADPRATRVGRWLRLMRLDELPNFLSVLRGDMSLVGPRPERPEFVAALERQVPLYRARLMARPGLTGWAQVNHPYGDSVSDAEAKLEYDLYYLKHRSLPFDAWIVLRTLASVAGFKGR